MLPSPPRTASGRRIYGPADTRALSFIRRARELGFTLGEIRALLALSGEGASESCAEVRDLAAMERVLADAVRRCDAGETPGCPVLDALSAA